MDNTDVNKVIAKFMGYIEVHFPEDSPVEGTALYHREYNHYIAGSYYTQSLDKLVSVREKCIKERIGIPNYTTVISGNHKEIIYHPFIEWIDRDYEIFPEFKCKTPSEAQAIAAAKVILELNNE